MAPRGTPKTRGRGGSGRGTGTARKTPASKRPADQSSDFEDNTPAAKKTKSALPPRDIPARKGRGQNSTRMDPTELHAVRPKRPDGTIAAERAERDAELAELARKRKEAMELLASLNAQQDAALAAAREDAINHIDDNELSELTASEDAMDCDEDDSTVLHITQDDFDRIEGDETYHSEVEVTPVPPKANPQKRKKKAEKGSTRAEIEELMNQKKEALAAKKALQDKNAAAVSNGAGISTDWKAKKTAQVNHEQDAPEDTPAMGGLTDEHAQGTRPDNTSKKARKNTLVAIISSDTEETPSKQPETKPKPRKARTPKTPTLSKLPALGVASSQSTLKTESSESSLTPAPAKKKNALPELVAKSWASVFLPAAYNALYTSEDPMLIGLVGDDPQNPGKETVELLQAVLDAKYPGNTLQLEWGDVICSKAVSRLGEERSHIGKYGLNIVDQLFRHDKYHKITKNPPSRLRKSQTIKADAEYALRHNGPAFHKVPTPEHLSPKDPGYIKPRGFLESAPIIKTLAWFIGTQHFRIIVTETPEGDVFDFSGLPIGALALVATAIERGYKAHLTGERAKPPSFSWEHYGTAVAGWISSTKNFKRSRWESILHAAGQKVIEHIASAPVKQETGSLDGLRENMYVPSSSPAPEDEDEEEEEEGEDAAETENDGHGHGQEEDGEEDQDDGEPGQEQEQEQCEQEERGKQ
ncbi:hypothetical protein FB45DRAFT_1024184 [Roridomyces roridus]|uniref:Uncharacterized protein n=1 Tax=Roridomyces roridus TaxID=1738132 RepID=A0AAD7C5L3_9AGAR|nr:hypothetical protein FB45DRAFT_1024184 [Roridomyces roridus]